MVKPLRDRDRDRDLATAEGPGPTMSPPLSPQPAAAPADGFASSDDEGAEEDPSPLHISWLSLSPLHSSEFLGLCSLPGCRFKDIRRNLQKDIGELKSCGIQDVFVLCTRGELSKYRVPNLIDAYQQHGMCVHHHPIPDGNAPDIATCCKILEELRTCLENKQKTMIHCYGGLGRSCLVAACLLLQLSDTLAPQQVIESLRNLRGSGAIQTIKYNFLHDFRENLAAHLATKEPLLRSASR
ncbi:cyclin-dependent kinase inhibitor 3 isoform X2 [Motacilla alba alba]|uniref:cyclin-dependent kinase inhibitor 3 isoform X2 n=1 Tax=Motacilla alba alba TaxID=1094192 RepID=UPI0018D59F24|nr:cyclin-dependent kinase inhibitor 3 isoform X2 [Motacilla alba alba]